jgi:heme-degrading monooxygenase HmoA
MTHWLTVAQPTLKARTIRGYESLIDLRILPAFRRHPIAALWASDIQAWVNSEERRDVHQSHP